MSKPNEGIDDESKPPLISSLSHRTAPRGPPPRPARGGTNRRLPPPRGPPPRGRPPRRRYNARGPPLKRVGMEESFSMELVRKCLKTTYSENPKEYINFVGRDPHRSFFRRKNVEKDLMGLVPSFNDANLTSSQKINLVFEFIMILVGVFDSFLEKKSVRSIYTYRFGNDLIKNFNYVFNVLESILSNEKYCNLFEHFLPRLKTILRKLYIKEYVISFNEGSEEFKNNLKELVSKIHRDENMSAVVEFELFESISTDVLFYQIMSFLSIHDLVENVSLVSKSFYENTWNLSLKNRNSKDHLDMYMIFRNDGVIKDSLLFKLFDFSAIDLHHAFSNNYIFPIMFQKGYNKSLQIVGSLSKTIDLGEKLESVFRNSQVFYKTTFPNQYSQFVHIIRMIESCIIFVRNRNPDFKLYERHCIGLVKSIMFPVSKNMYLRGNSKLRTQRKCELIEMILSVFDGDIENFMIGVICGFQDEDIFDQDSWLKDGDDVEKDPFETFYQVIRWFLQKYDFSEACLYLLCFQNALFGTRVLKMLFLEYGVNPAFDNHGLFLHCCQNACHNSVRLLLEFESIDPSFGNNQGLLSCLEAISNSDENLYKVDFRTPFFGSFFRKKRKNIRPVISAPRNFSHDNPLGLPDPNFERKRKPPPSVSAVDDWDDDWDELEEKNEKKKILRTGRLVDTVQQLLETGKVSLSTKKHWSVFSEVCKKGILWKNNNRNDQFNIFLMSLLRKTDVSLIDHSPLISLLETRSPSPFSSFLKTGHFDPSYEKNKFLVFSCEHAFHDIVKILLKFESVDPTFPDNEPIKVACRSSTNENDIRYHDFYTNNSTKVVKLLLKTGKVDPSVDNYYCLKNCKDISVIKVLLGHPKIDISRNNYECVTDSIVNSDLFRFYIDRKDVPIESLDLVTRICEKFVEILEPSNNTEIDNRLNFMYLLRHSRVKEIPVRFQNYFIMETIRMKKGDPFIRLLNLFKGQSEEMIEEFEGCCRISGWDPGLRILKKQRKN